MVEAGPATPDRPLLAARRCVADGLGALAEDVCELTEAFGTRLELADRQDEPHDAQTHTRSVYPVPPHQLSPSARKRFGRVHRFLCFLSTRFWARIARELTILTKHSSARGTESFILPHCLRFLHVIRSPHPGRSVASVTGTNVDFRGTSKSAKCGNRGKRKRSVFEHKRLCSDKADAGRPHPPPRSRIAAQTRCGEKGKSR